MSFEWKVYVQLYVVLLHDVAARENAQLSLTHHATTLVAAVLPEIELTR